MGFGEDGTWQKGASDMGVWRVSGSFAALRMTTKTNSDKDKQRQEQTTTCPGLRGETWGTRRVGFFAALRMAKHAR
jgi:hypothetical protein